MCGNVISKSAISFAIWVSSYSFLDVKDVFICLKNTSMNMADVEGMNHGCLLILYIPLEIICINCNWRTSTYQLIFVLLTEEIAIRAIAEKTWHILSNWCTGVLGNVAHSP